MEIRTPDIPTALEPAAELDQLGDEIAELSAHIEAATAHLLDLIREFDARGGWNTGFRSCAAWLAWRVGLDPGAARERVRVAHALGTLPLLARALARGELSYAKVRALTRVATPETEGRLLALGRPAPPRTSSGSFAAGVVWIGRPRLARPPGGTRAGRCTCIRVRTAWSFSGAGWRRRSGLCSCRRWPPRARRCTSSSRPTRWPCSRRRPPTTRRRASVPAPGRAAPARGAASCCDTLRSRPGPAGRHEAGGLRLHARPAIPGWLGERLDVGWAIDVMHPLAG